MYHHLNALNGFKCLKFGHVTDKCRSHVRCTGCGKNHDVVVREIEKANFKCANWENHSAAYGGCLKMKEQAYINSVIVIEGNTRLQTKNRTVHSYANLVKKHTLWNCATNSATKSQIRI